MVPRSLTRHGGAVLLAASRTQRHGLWTPEPVYSRATLTDAWLCALMGRSPSDFGTTEASPCIARFFVRSLLNTIKTSRCENSIPPSPRNWEHSSTLSLTPLPLFIGIFVSSCPCNSMTKATLTLLSALLPFALRSFAAIGPEADLTIVNANISPDGYERAAVLAGGTFPGPLITGNKGDHFKINVIDQLTNHTMLKSTSIVSSILCRWSADSTLTMCCANAAFPWYKHERLQLGRRGGLRESVSYYLRRVVLVRIQWQRSSW